MPMFVRKLKEIEITSTFKHQKVELRKEGINLDVVKDPLFWLNPAINAYEPFTKKSLELLSSGKAKL